MRALNSFQEVACSIANRSMLPEARVLNVPDDPDGGPFEILSIAAAGIDVDLCFQARMQQLSYLATPFLLRALLGSGARRVLFFKQETLICSSARDRFDADRPTRVTRYGDRLDETALGDM